MIFRATPLAGLYEIDPLARVDTRGRFTRLYCEQALAEVAPGCRVLQVNHSLTLERGSVRGLHFQREGALEGKLVRCLRGRVFDVAVDLRAGSPSFGCWHAVELSGDNSRQVWIPTGFAHGFQTLSDDAELLYLHTAAYSPPHEAGLRHDDPRLAIAWPLAPHQVSPRDMALPWLDASFEGVRV